jgi:hypothetical protein
MKEFVEGLHQQGQHWVAITACKTKKLRILRCGHLPDVYLSVVCCADRYPAARMKEFVEGLHQQSQHCMHTS